MITQIPVRSVFIGAVLGVVGVLSIGAAMRPGTVFEYKFVRQYRLTNNEASPQTFEQAINAAAAEGWEVVGYAAGGEGGASVLVRKAKQ